MDSISDLDLKLELDDVFDAGDVARIKELFEKHDLTPGNAQWCLDDLVGFDENLSVDVARCLLKLGAKASEVSILYLRMCRSLAVFKLFAEEGLDYKKIGHELLEDVVDSREIVDFLLDQGVDINRPDPARYSGGAHIGAMAQRKGMPVEPNPYFDKTLGVLNNTAALGDCELFSHLVARGADVTKSIALHEATRCKDPVKTKQMIAHLIDCYHIDVNAEDDATDLRNIGNPWEFGTPLQFAILHQNKAAVEALVEHGAHYRNLGAATIYNNPWYEGLKTLLELGADPNGPLRSAVRHNKPSFAELCLEYGADLASMLTEGDGKIVYADLSPEMKAVLEA